MPNGTYGGVRGRRKSSLLDLHLSDLCSILLDESTRKFFESFGVDMDKVYVEFIPVFTEAEEGAFFLRDCYKIEFVFAGYFEAIPSSQWEFYFGFVDDEPPIFDVDENTPEIVEVDDGIVVHSSEEKMGIYRFGEASVSSGDFEGWNSGYTFCRSIFRI